MDYDSQGVAKGVAAVFVQISVAWIPDTAPSASAEVEIRFDAIRDWLVTLRRNSVLLQLGIQVRPRDSQHFRHLELVAMRSLPSIENHLSFERFDGGAQGVLHMRSFRGRLPIQEILEILAGKHVICGQDACPFEHIAKFANVSGP